jgi:hypothetical protein
MLFVNGRSSAARRSRTILRAFEFKRQKEGAEVTMRCIRCRSQSLSGGLGRVIALVDVVLQKADCGISFTIQKVAI